MCVSLLSLGLCECVCPSVTYGYVSVCSSVGLCVFVDLRVCVSLSGLGMIQVFVCLYPCVPSVQYPCVFHSSSCENVRPEGKERRIWGQSLCGKDKFTMNEGGFPHCSSFSLSPDFPLQA